MRSVNLNQNPKVLHIIKPCKFPKILTIEMSCKKPSPQPEQPEHPHYITIRKAESLNFSCLCQQKLSFVQIRRRIFIHSLNDGDQDLRMALFSLLMKSMTLPEARNKALFDRIRHTLRKDGSNDEFTQTIAKGLELAYAKDDSFVERTLIDVFNTDTENIIIERLKQVYDMENSRCPSHSIQQIVTWFDRKFNTSLILVPFCQSLLLSHSRPDLIDYKHKVLKLSAKPHLSEMSESSDSMLSLLSVPKKEHTASDFIQITLSKSPICLEECEGVAITEFRPPEKQKRKSLWDMLCCNE